MEKKYEIQKETVAYPVEFPGGASLLVHLRWPDPSSVRQLFNQQNIELKPVGNGKSEVFSKDSSYLFDFLLSHFEKFTRMDGSDLEDRPEDHMVFIRDNPSLNIPRVVILGSLFRVKVLLNEDSEIDSLAGLTASKGVVTLEVREWDLKEGCWINYKISPRIADPTREQFKRWERTTKVIKDVKHETVNQQEDVQTIQKLWENQAIEIEGATIGGQPCTSDNKEAWCRDVFFHIVHAAMNEFYSGVRQKN